MRMSLLDVFHGRKNMLVALGVSVAALLAIEMIIFTIFALSSGEQSRIEVRDKSGKPVYNVAGTTLSHINFSYFERKYGDLGNYDVEIKTINKPFPVRAWVSASVGIPLALILLISYLVKVYLALLQSGDHPDHKGELYPAIYEERHPFISWSLFLSSSSIFLTGAFIAVFALLFWMVPNFLGELLDVSAAAIKGNSWVIWGAAAFLACFAAWVVYLRYRLSGKMMDYQYRLEKQRLEQRFLGQAQLAPDVREATIEKRGEG